jgi:hypothetical protein
MKVLNYFIQADRAKVRSALEAMAASFGKTAGEKGLDNILEAMDEVIQMIGVKEDLDHLVIRQETDSLLEGDSPKTYTDVIAVDKDGDEWSISFIPWGIIRELEVQVSPELSELTLDEIAAFIAYEITFQGSEEDARERQMQIHETWDSGEFEELKPGVVISPQVKAAMDADPELRKVLEKLSLEDIKGKGKRVRDE